MTDLISHIKPLKELVPQEHRRRFTAWLKREKKQWIRELTPGTKVWFWNFVGSDGSGPMQVKICGEFTPGSRGKYKRCDCLCDKHSIRESPVVLTAGSNYTHLWVWVHLPVDLSVKGTTENTPGAQYQACPASFFKSEKEAWQAWLNYQYNSSTESSIEFQERMIKVEQKRAEQALNQRKETMFAIQRMNEKAISMGCKMPKKRTKKVRCWRAGSPGLRAV